MEYLLPSEGVATTDAASAAGWINPAAWLQEKKLSRGFWVFFAVAFFFDFGFAVYFFLFNLFLVDLHFNERAIGLVGGALTLGSVAGTLPAGWIARRTGLRPLLIGCFTMAPLFGVLRTIFVQEAAQIALAFLAGVAVSIWGVCFLPAIAGLTTEKNRSSAFSLIFSVSIGTSALGGLVCGYLPDWLRMAGYAMQGVEIKRWMLIASCGIVALGLLPLAAFRMPPSQPEPQHHEDGKRQRWKIQPFLLRFLPAMALWAAVLASFTPFANVYLSRDLHISLSRIGLIFSAAQIVQLCVVLLSPLVFRRLGLVPGIVATQIATAAALACLSASRDVRLAVALYLSFSALQWMSSPGLYNLLMSRTPERDRSAAAAMTLFCNAILQSGATALTGMLFTQFGYPRVLVGIAGFATVVALLFGCLVAPAARRASAQP
jgi:predicted MFS family arabinose efflux permease